MRRSQQHNPVLMASPTEEPLVLATMRCSYSELISTIERLPFSNHQGQTLPLEIVHKIGSYFTVKAVDMTTVKATKASSMAGDYPLKASLDESTNNWWISRVGSMPLGKGREYVQYSLSDRLCRLSSFSIRIPPLPVGPLSVRALQLEGKNEISGWSPISPIWLVENTSEWQSFALNPPVDVQHVRVVCFSNQISAVLEDATGGRQFEAVGFYSLRFD